MQRISTHYALAALSGFLLYLGWPPLNTAWILFFAWLPLLWVIDIRIKQHKGTYRFVYITFLIWNVCTTWWIWFSTPAGAIAAIILNALLMSIPIMGYVWVRKLYPKLSILSYAALVIFWLSFEYVHLHWELAWPWLTLGNGLSTLPQLVQWYSVTGRLGGTVWIWVVNLCVYDIYRLSRFRQLKRPAANYLLLVMIIAIPCGVSLYSLYKVSNNEAHGKPALLNAIAVQPNADPYNFKFDPATVNQQIETLINLSEQAVDSTTDLIFWPETSLPQPVELNNVNSNPGVIRIRVFLHKYPRVTLITGAEAYRTYNAKITETCKLYDGKYVDSYNAALCLDTSQHYQEYYKSKFVPGVESVPYYSFFKFLEPILVHFGGMTGSYGKQEHATAFTTRFRLDDRHLKLGTAICYESVFGDFCRDYIRDSAQLLSIITNDGWWENTDGHKQHALYASLLAIELHRDIVRSANTGTSCFVDAHGFISQTTNWWQPTVIKSAVRLYNDCTPFEIYGDILGKISLYLSLLVVVLLTVYSRFYDSRKA